MEDITDEIYKMQKWSDEDILDELQRPTHAEGYFQHNVMKEAVRRIFEKLIKLTH